jgi:hypothetical protein
VLLNAANNALRAADSTVAGSSLRYNPTSGITAGQTPFSIIHYQVNNSAYGGGGTALSGTWRKMGFGNVYVVNTDSCSGQTFYYWYSGLYVRIA